MLPLTNKARLEAVLAGKPIDVPPHFELVFQLEQEAFGIDLLNWQALQSAGPAERERNLANIVEMSTRLVDEYGWAAVQGPTAQLKAAVGDRALVYDFNGNGTFWLMSGDDTMQFVIRLFEDPQSLHEEARRKCDESIALARRQADAGVDFIIINSDYGFNTGPFISPKHFQEFVTPYLTEIVDAVHELGLLAILHSDGNLKEILGQLHGAGLDGYQSVDPQGFMDIREVRAQYPDWILMGNVMCSLLQDTDEQRIRESVRYCMSYGGIGERYIFSTSNCIFAGMPLRSYHVMLDEYRRCCGAEAART